MAVPFWPEVQTCSNDVAVDEHAPRVLQLERVLGRHPVGAPRQPLRAQVAPDFDVGRHQTVDGGIGAAEHDVLARRLEEVVHDLERPCAVPSADRLRIAVRVVEVLEVGVDDRHPHAVQRDAAAIVALVVAVQVAAIDDDVGRLGLDRRVLARSRAPRGWTAARRCRRRRCRGRSGGSRGRRTRRGSRPRFTAVARIFGITFAFALSARTNGGSAPLASNAAVRGANRHPLAGGNLAVAQHEAAFRRDRAERRGRRPAESCRRRWPGRAPSAARRRWSRSPGAAPAGTGVQKVAT